MSTGNIDRLNTLKAAVVAAWCLVVSACGGSSSGGGGTSPPPPPPVAQNYTVTLTEIELLKKGSSERLDVDGLPAEGATLTVD